MNLLVMISFYYALIVVTICHATEEEELLRNKNNVKGKIWPKSWQELSNNEYHSPPFVMTTWDFTGAAQAAWDVLTKQNGTALDAVVEGCGYCERTQCGFTVGYGGSPDETGETTLDAMIIDGDSLNIGSIGGLRRIKNAIGVAKAVMIHSEHTILVGDAATNFGKQMGFTEESLSTNRSTAVWQKWKENNCQPNFWKGVTPDSRKSCGPYSVSPGSAGSNPGHLPSHAYDRGIHHDTIGQIVMDASGSIAAGLSSNGAQHKIPGRMGDAPIPGAGGFADSDVGAAAATGDGDIMMRFSPTALVVEKMRKKMSPGKAVSQVIRMMREKFPSFQGGLVAFNKGGDFAAACNGIKKFPFTVARSDVGGVRTYYVNCVKGPQRKTDSSLKRGLPRVVYTSHR